MMLRGERLFHFFQIFQFSSRSDVCNLIGLMSPNVVIEVFNLSRVSRATSRLRLSRSIDIARVSRSRYAASTCKSKLGGASAKRVARGAVFNQ